MGFILLEKYFYTTVIENVSWGISSIFINFGNLNMSLNVFFPAICNAAYMPNGIRVIKKRLDKTFILQVIVH